jgi:chromosome segregation ATPase
MNQTEFVAATAIILFVTFVLGWVTQWAIARFSRVTQADMGELDTLASQLHEAEEERDQALTLLEDRERAMSSQMAQVEAELSAAMEGLREARREAQDLRTQLERAKRAQG